MDEAARVGDVFVTVTGNKSVITARHFKAMKDGAIVANSGHFNVEIDLQALEALASAKRQVREFVQEYTLSNRRKVFVLAEGRLINLAAAEGHPAMVMDMSFANQALSVLHLVKNAAKLDKAVYSVPKDIDAEIARLKLGTMGDLGVDVLGHDGRQDRQADAGAESLPGRVAGRDLSPAGRKVGPRTRRASGLPGA
jgi:adenosylhomocysteinase